MYGVFFKQDAGSEPKRSGSIPDAFAHKAHALVAIQDWRDRNPGGGCEHFVLSLPKTTVCPVVEGMNHRPAGALGVNPKDLVGSTKVDLDLIPGSAEVACALAMTDGGFKYGPYNWREQGKPVQARTYTSAARRHLKKWFDGEEFDADSGVHHLGHAMACCAILIDAQACGQLADNRPAKGSTSAALKAGEATVKRLTEAAKARKK